MWYPCSLWNMVIVFCCCMLVCVWYLMHIIFEITVICSMYCFLKQILKSTYTLYCSMFTYMELIWGLATILCFFGVSLICVFLCRSIESYPKNNINTSSYQNSITGNLLSLTGFRWLWFLNISKSPLFLV